MQKYLQTQEEGGRKHTEENKYHPDFGNWAGGGGGNGGLRIGKPKQEFSMSVKIFKPLIYSVKQEGWFCNPNNSYKNPEAQGF